MNEQVDKVRLCSYYDNKTKQLEKTVTVPLRLPQIPHRLTWDRSPAAMLKHNTVCMHSY